MLEKTKEGYVPAKPKRVESINVQVIESPSIYNGKVLLIGPHDQLGKLADTVKINDGKHGKHYWLAYEQGMLRLKATNGKVLASVEIVEVEFSTAKDKYLFVPTSWEG